MTTLEMWLFSIYNACLLTYIVYLTIKLEKYEEELEK